MNPPVCYFTESNDDYFVTIRDGKVTLFKQGNYVFLSCPIILKNGIVVNMDGNMQMPDGSTRTLREGEHA